MFHYLCFFPSNLLTLILSNLLIRWNTQRVSLKKYIKYINLVFNIYIQDYMGIKSILLPQFSSQQRQLYSGKSSSPMAFLSVSKHFTVTPIILFSSNIFQSISFKGWIYFVYFFTLNLINRLCSLYTQSYRLMLAVDVSPLLLARQFATTYSYANVNFFLFQKFFLRVKKIFTIYSTFIDHTILLRQAFAHCEIFHTAVFIKKRGFFSAPLCLYVR